MTTDKTTRFKARAFCFGLSLPCLASFQFKAVAGEISDSADHASDDLH